MSAVLWIKIAMILSFPAKFFYSFWLKEYLQELTNNSVRLKNILNLSGQNINILIAIKNPRSIANKREETLQVAKIESISFYGQRSIEKGM